MTGRSVRRRGAAPRGASRRVSRPKKGTPPRRRKETRDQLRARARSVLGALRREYPGARTELSHTNAFQLLIATILSAQCTDVRVNMVTAVLFAKYPTPDALGAVSQGALEEEIRSTGFYRMKAKNVLACCKALNERFGGEVPQRMEDLVTLPGVGRKTANVVLGQAFGIASGVVVDTHVQRLAGRLGFTDKDDPVKIEADLMDVFPVNDWIDVGSVLILHGRRTCKARTPDCPSCPVNDRCPSAT
ncbi:MAG TPA: endonuclease III [Bacteroidota bacterium]|nr:endonuclease III [Bacteroidota bacterium]